MVAKFRQFLKYFQILYTKDFASKYKNIKFSVWFGCKYDYDFDDREWD